MSFGIQNLGVINQKQSPAIWQSDITDFPPNYILGRILIDTFAGGIYLDTSISRVQIQASGAGNINYTNGIVNFGLTSPYTSNVGLGGALVLDSSIDVTGKSLAFVGSIATTIIAGDGSVIDDISQKLYFPTSEQNIAVIVPDKLLIFTDPISGNNYSVLCKKN
jgi:hypothetical protein